MGLAVAGGDLLLKAYAEACKRLSSSRRAEDMDGLHSAVVQWIESPPAVRDVEHGANWLLQVGRRRRIDEFRRSSRRLEPGDVTAAEAPSLPAVTDELEVLQAAITDRQRANLQLWLRGVTCDAAAVPLGCCKQAVSQARRRISKVAKAIGGDK